MASRTIPTSSDVERRAVNAEDARLAFEREKWEAERKLREQEMAFREADRPSPWRSPLTIAVVAAAMAGAGNAVVSQLNGSAQLRVQREQGKAGADLEKIKAEQNLIIEAIKTGGDVDKAAANLEFLVNTGLVTDKQRANQIRHYIAVNRLNPERLPSLPSVGQTQPSVARKALPASAPVFLSPRDNPALKVTNRASAIRPGQSCRAGTSGYCVANDVLVDSAGKTVAVADATYNGDRMRPPKLIVFHSTYGSDGGGVRLLTSKSVGGGSAHVIIDRDGTVTQLVPFDVTAYHVSNDTGWNGITDINHQSISIEFSNYGEIEGSPGAWTRDEQKFPDEAVFVTQPDAQGRVHGWERFTDAQLAAAERIVAALITKYPSIEAIVGHADLSKSTHTDPGPALSLVRFRALLRK